MKKHAIIIDLDGTLALFEHVRTWHEENKVEKDVMRPSAYIIAKSYKFTLDRSIIVVSGRTKGCLEGTVRWLNNYEFPFDRIYLRDTDDKRPDTIVKKEIYEKEIGPHFEIDFVLDDRNSVVAMWRELGLDCYQVAITNY